LRLNYTEFSQQSCSHFKTTQIGLTSETKGNYRMRAWHYCLQLVSLHDGRSWTL